VTLGDVAREAGVSPMTVSRVSNGETNVRDSTRDAVNAAIRKLGYSPNKAARSLASASQVQVGLLYTNPSSTYLSAMLLGALEQARESNTQVIVTECAPGADAEKVIIEQLRAGIDGIMLVPPLADSPELLGVLKQRDVLTVTMGTQRLRERVASVTIDDRGAARTMTEYLIRLGHRRIGFITGTPTEAGRFGFSVQAEDALGQVDTQVLAIVVDGEPFCDANPDDDICQLESTGCSSAPGARGPLGSPSFLLLLVATGFMAWRRRRQNG